MFAADTLSPALMVAVLRKGKNGAQIMEILDAIVPSENEISREQICADLGIADCPENDDEIATYAATV
jgi:hypothetical protein